MKMQLKAGSDLHQLMENYIRNHVKKSVSAGRFFSDCGVLVHDEERLQTLFIESTEAFIQDVEQLIQEMTDANTRASVPVMARVLFTMIDKTTEDIRRFEGTAFYDEYIEQLIWIVLNYIEK